MKIEQYLKEFHQEIINLTNAHVSIIRGDYLIDVIAVEFINSSESITKIEKKQTFNILEDINLFVETNFSEHPGKETIFHHIPAMVYSFPLMYIILPKNYLKYESYEPQTDARQIMEQISKHTKNTKKALIKIF
jgi:hypothetical protein